MQYIDAAHNDMLSLVSNFETFKETISNVLLFTKFHVLLTNKYSSILQMCNQTYSSQWHSWKGLLPNTSIIVMTIFCH
jgi:flagellar biosynthesis protein FlhB